MYHGRKFINIIDMKFNFTFHEEQFYTIFCEDFIEIYNKALHKFEM